MEPGVVSSRNRSMQPLRAIAVLSLGASLLTGCSFASSQLGGASSQQDALLYSTEQASNFEFPQPTCGESSSEPRETWYVVYVDRANPDEIRRQYCNDAIGTVRRETGVPTVQVASFTDYSRALRFAAAVGGEVEVMTGDQVAAGATDEGARQAQAVEANTAYLMASEPGSVINIRERASTSAPIQQTGRSGDQVQIADETQGEDGKTWYRVTLTPAGEGWVRGDFVTRNRPGESGNFTTNGSPATGASAQTSPSPGTGAETAADRYGSSPGNSSNPYSSSTSGDRYGASQFSTSQFSTSQSGTGQSSANPYSENSSYGAHNTTTPNSGDSSSERASHDGYVLTANDPGAVINIREDASTTSSVRHTGYAGDPVHIADVTQGEDGYTWYYVEFDSGVSGWVRGDFVD